MLRFPAQLTPETFLSGYWQKQPLFMPQAIDGPTPSISRNELGWLATLDDVESRIVFVDRDGGSTRFRAETGPFDETFLQNLPKRDWTLLVHDVEKHLPEMRALFRHVPFIPDWRIDDLMVSFAAPGGGVGPHKDNYDVFLCQGTGKRNWRFTTDDVASNPGASDDLALLTDFDGEEHDTRAGDILYLPPGAPHCGMAIRACITYSIGMRAPQLSDLCEELPDEEATNPFYEDPDLSDNEARAGYISSRAVERAARLLRGASASTEGVAVNLGRFVTETKEWITPERPSADEVRAMQKFVDDGGTLLVHGMARIAWDDHFVYTNGAAMPYSGDSTFIGSICASRSLSGRDAEVPELLAWMLEQGAFEIPEHL